MYCVKTSNHILKRFRPSGRSTVLVFAARCCNNNKRLRTSYFVEETTDRRKASRGLSATAELLVVPYLTLWQYSIGDPITGATSSSAVAKRPRVLRVCQ